MIDFASPPPHKLHLDSPSFTEANTAGEWRKKKTCHLGLVSWNWISTLGSLRNIHPMLYFSTLAGGAAPPVSNWQFIENVKNTRSDCGLSALLLVHKYAHFYIVISNLDSGKQK